ncbi:MAG: HAD family hydrolase [Ruminococcaceae bacterium]|nr:HAD family hydrolase [Oscillospiraceae bacterium]
MIKFVNTGSPSVIGAFEEREILYAFHDIDGTHSLIRDWPPVMSIVLHYVSENGVPDGYDSDEQVKTLVSLAGTKPLPETDSFCIESAGLSALTQMEWAIRRAIDAGHISVPCNKDENRRKIEMIRKGEEIFENPDSEELSAFLTIHTPRLFKFYEKVLNGFCRDKNLELAKKDPDRFIVSGSKEFLELLYKNGVKNYFVTGAVVEKGMGMHEEVETLGFEIGNGKIVEDLIGSTWTDKIPKDQIMEKLLQTLGADGKNVIVIGDGRSEISAGVKMGALCVSRLEKNDTYRRALHKKLGSNIVLESYLEEDFLALIRFSK